MSDEYYTDPDWDRQLMEAEYAELKGYNEPDVKCPCCGGNARQIEVLLWKCSGCGRVLERSHS